VTAAMPWTSWSPLTEDGVSTGIVTESPWTTTGVVVDGGSNWKTLILGVFVIAGVTGKSHD